MKIFVISPRTVIYAIDGLFEFILVLIMQIIITNHIYAAILIEKLSYQYDHVSISTMIIMNHITNLSFLNMYISLFNQ